MHTVNRPTFFTEIGQPIRAAGILCYVNHKFFNKDRSKDTSKNDKKIWLLRKQNESFSDTGGKTDIVDQTIIDTAIRETVEETNGHLFSFHHTFEECTNILVKEFKKQNPVPIYSENCKYIVFPLKLRYKNKLLSLKRFGNKEIHDDMEHSYEWIENIPKNIHPRLKSIRKQLI